MHARGWVQTVVFGSLVAVAATAAAEPALKPVDIKDLKAKALVLTDPQGGTYVIFRGDESKVFFGPNAKTLYEQAIVGSGSDGEGGWEFSTWAPRVANGSHLGSLDHKKDGTTKKSCGEKDEQVLTELSGDRAKAIVDKAAFMSSGVIHVPHLLARDDSGVYYYVDRIAKAYGGKGYRVFVGKKGAMKQLPLTDVARDTAGEVYATKSGDVRFVIDGSDTKKDTAFWIKGEKKSPLSILDVDANSRIIWGELGVYSFLGTPCDEL
jgi:hypothetical protein